MTALPVKSLAGGALLNDFLGFQDKWKDLIGDCPPIHSMANGIASGAPVEQQLRVDS